MYQLKMMTTVKNKAIKVLVVDDNETFCENLKELLQSQGYQSDCVYDGFQALDVIKQEPPDVVLLDVRLPKMDGLTTFRKIKEMAPQIPVIMMTGFAVENVIQQAMNEGVLAHFHKPMDIDKLDALIKRAARRD